MRNPNYKKTCTSHLRERSNWFAYLLWKAFIWFDFDNFVFEMESFEIVSVSVIVRLFDCTDLHFKAYWVIVWSNYSSVTLSSRPDYFIKQNLLIISLVNINNHRWKSSYREDCGRPLSPIGSRLLCIGQSPLYGIPHLKQTK